MKASKACNDLNELPLAQAKRLDDAYLIDIVKTLAERDVKALELFQKNWLRNKARKEYLRKRDAAMYLQNLYFRGFFRSNRYLPDITADGGYEGEGEGEGEDEEEGHLDEDGQGEGEGEGEEEEEAGDVDSNDEEEMGENENENEVDEVEEIE